MLSVLDVCIKIFKQTRLYRHITLPGVSRMDVMNSNNLFSENDSLTKFITKSN